MDPSWGVVMLSMLLDADATTMTRHQLSQSDLEIQQFVGRVKGVYAGTAAAAGVMPAGTQDLSFRRVCL